MFLVCQLLARTILATPRSPILDDWSTLCYWAINRDEELAGCGCVESEAAEIHRARWWPFSQNLLLICYFL